MSLHSHLRFWFVAFIFLIASMVIFSTPTVYGKVIYKDLGRTYDTYGEAKMLELLNNANSGYRALFGSDNPLAIGVKSFYVTNAREASAFGFEEAFTDRTNKMLMTFKLLVFAIFLRSAIAFQWLVALFVMGAAAVVDGLVARKIKIVGYGFTSPAIQARMTHLCILLWGSAAVMFFLPISVPLIWWPFSIGLTILSIRFYVSNAKQVTV